MIAQQVSPVLFVLLAGDMIAGPFTKRASLMSDWVHVGPFFVRQNRTVRHLLPLASTRKKFGHPPVHFLESYNHHDSYTYQGPNWRTERAKCCSWMRKFNRVEDPRI